MTGTTDKMQKATLLLFSSLLAGQGALADTPIQEPISHGRSASAQALDGTIIKALERVYADKAGANLELYKAGGLYPLIRQQITPQSDDMDILRVINEILQNYWLRGRTEERWDLTPERFIQSYQDRLKSAYLAHNIKEPIFTTDVLIGALPATGIYDEKPLPKKDFEAAILLGSTHQNFILRLRYLLESLDKDPHTELRTLYFLCGARPLDAKFESEAIAELQAKKVAVLNEYTMMEFYAQKLQQDYPRLKSLVFKFVVSPEHEGIRDARTRATTSDTYRDLFEQYKPQETQFLIISSAPFITYQDAISQHHFYEYSLQTGITRFAYTIGADVEATSAVETKLPKAYLQNLRPILALDSLAREFYERRNLMLNLEQRHQSAPKPNKP